MPDSRSHQSNVPGMGPIDWMERRTGQALLGVLFMKLGFDAARSPGPRVEKAGRIRRRAAVWNGGSEEIGGA